jgi:hypothetical protein
MDRVVSRPLTTHTRQVESEKVRYGGLKVRVQTLPHKAVRRQRARR